MAAEIEFKDRVSPEDAANYKCKWQELDSRRPADDRNYALYSCSRWWVHASIIRLSTLLLIGFSV